MKSNIKALNLLMILGFFMIFSNETSAQTGPTDCRIWYSYDGAGNRVKREYKCVPTYSPYDPVPPVVTDPLGGVSVYPNPTTGVITVIFSEMVASASFIIFAANGTIVQTYSLSQPSVSVTFDITMQVPGTYFISITTPSITETHTVIKIQ